MEAESHKEAEPHAKQTKVRTWTCFTCMRGRPHMHIPGTHIPDGLCIETKGGQIPLSLARALSLSPPPRKTTCLVTSGQIPLSLSLSLSAPP